jgi:radical SAM protein with 4Fe4S-binding SPASM domain
MSFELFKSIIDQFKQRSFLRRKIDLTGVGEPLLNPKLMPMIEYAKGHGLEVSFVSNFTLMNQETATELIKAKLDRLYISVDAGSREIFEKMRPGADFETVTDNVRLFVEARKNQNADTPKLVFRSTISEDNAGETAALIRLAEILGVDGIVFFPQLVPRKRYYSSDLFAPPSRADTSLAVVENSTPSPERAPICRSYSRCYITFDGKVLPCPCLTQMIPREQYSRFQFGDIQNSPFVKIWFSTKYRQFRVRGALGRPYMSLCKYCPYSPEVIKEADTIPLRGDQRLEALLRRNQRMAV